jgi:hypothetical protein
MSWANRVKALGVIAVASLALAMVGCTSSSSSSKKKSSGGGGTVSSDNASSMSGSIQGAMSSAESGETPTTALVGTPLLPSHVMKGLSKLPRFYLPSGGNGKPGNALDTYTSVYAFSGDYPCSVSGTVGASGTLTDTVSVETTTYPYYADDQFSTSDPIALTLTACSDGDWTLDGDVTFDMADDIYIESADGAFDDTVFDYTYAESFDASVTGTQLADSIDVTADMTYDLTGDASGSIDGSGNLTYDTFDWEFDITVNGDSYSCSWTDPTVDPTCQ